MRSRGRFAILFGVLTACSVRTSFNDSNFLCPDGETCPDDQICVDFVCTSEDTSREVSFTDDTQGDFAAAELSGVVWSGDRVTLADGVLDGRLVSRVFDAGVTADWTAFEWTPAAPYGTGSPGNATVESGYAEGNLDMTRNVLLLQFDGGEGLPEGAAIADRSGQANNATVRVPGRLEVTEGVADFAIVDTVASRLEVAAANVGDFQFGASDLTWSVWVKTRTPCAGETSEANQAYIGIEDENDGSGENRAHMWLGCSRPQSSSCDPGPENGRGGGTFCSAQIQPDRDCAGFCGTTDITDDQWHHLAVRKIGHENAELTLFVDGQIEDVVAGSFRDAITFDTYDLGVGHFAVAEDPDSQDAEGILDEVSIWRRALTSAEIADHYRRGALSLRFRVRACQEAGCADDPAFVGPDGTPATSFTDASDEVGIAQFALGDLGLTGRYFQYEASFATLRLPEGPGLLATKVVVNRSENREPRRWSARSHCGCIARVSHSAGTSAIRQRDGSNREG